MPRPYVPVGTLVTKRVGRSRLHEVHGAADEAGVGPVVLTLLDDREYLIRFDAAAKRFVVYVR